MSNELKYRLLRRGTSCKLAPCGISNLTSNQIGAADAITNTSFNRVSSISRTGSSITFTYNPDNQRNKSHYVSTTPALDKKTYYVGNYEKVVTNGATIEEYDYICTPDGLSAIAIKTGGTTTFYYVNTDHLGSIRTITKADKTVQSKSYYDAWGVQYTPFGTSITTRGYTGHEHLPLEFGLINMNARMYDPVLGRFLEVDPYVAFADYTQGYNRYTYAMNNPLMYIDPTGENPIVIAIVIIIGAAAGGYTGAKIAKAKGYDFGDWQTYAFMLGGAVIGGAAGYTGTAFAAAGGFMASTMGIVYSSAFSSIGMGALSGGMIEAPTISFGAASLDMGTLKFNSFNKNNKWYQNVGYGLGAMANLADLNLAINNTPAELITEGKGGGFPHNAIRTKSDKSNLMSFGPESDSKLAPLVKKVEPSWLQKGLNTIRFGLEPRTSTSDYWFYEKLIKWNTDVNVNKYTFNAMQGVSRVLPYQGATINCTNVASVSLWLNGIPNIGIHPYILHATTWAYSAGIRPDLYSYYLQNNY